MPSLFRRKPADVAPEPSAPEAPTAESRTKRHTPSKRELGKETPKRRNDVRRTVEPPPANRREAVKRMREKQRAERAEARQGMLAGDERFLLPRDRGPERALVRDIVDSRRTMGTWFFGVTFVVMLLNFNAAAFNPSINLATTLLFLTFAAATAIDSFLIARTVKQLVRQRHPDSKQRMGGLYLYAIMRAISFRFIRTPKPRVKWGTKI